MICLRCGYCCKHYFVAIVDDPAKGFTEDNLIMHDGNGLPCKHLVKNENGKHSCAIHHYPWYQETDCFRHTQVESDPRCECRLGREMLGGYNKERI